MSSEIVIQPWSANEYSNLALVQEVKKHPCLYNNTIPEYSQKEVTGRVWAEIAEKFGCSVSLAKTRWKNLRMVYTRYVKEAAKSKNRKAYYLAKDMNFLLPYIDIDDFSETVKKVIKYAKNFESSRIANDSANVNPISELAVAISYVQGTDAASYRSQNKSKDNNATISHIQEASTVSPCHSQNKSEDNSAITSGISSGGKFRKIAPKPSVSELHKVNEANQKLTVAPTIIQFVKMPDTTAKNVQPTIIHGVETEDTVKNIQPAIIQSVKMQKDTTKNVQPTVENPRRQFIMSLLPEINGMSDTQFFKFKRKLFQLVDDLAMEE